MNDLRDACAETRRRYLATLERVSQGRQETMRPELSRHIRQLAERVRANYPGGVLVKVREPTPEEMLLRYWQRWAAVRRPREYWEPVSEWHAHVFGKASVRLPPGVVLEGGYTGRVLRSWVGPGSRAFVPAALSLMLDSRP